jgi:excisionase family DNA binding protein
MTDKERKIRSLRTHSEDPLLSFSEVGQQLGVTRTAVAQWAETGRLAYCRLPGGRRRVRQSVVDRIREEIVANGEPEYLRED